MKPDGSLSWVEAVVKGLAEEADPEEKIRKFVKARKELWC